MGLEAYKRKEQNRKYIHGVIFRGNIWLFLFVNFLLFEFCQNFVDSRRLNAQWRNITMTKVLLLAMPEFDLSG